MGLGCLAGQDLCILELSEGQYPYTVLCETDDGGSRHYQDFSSWVIPENILLQIRNEEMW